MENEPKKLADGMLYLRDMSIKDEATSFGALGGNANFAKNGKEHMSKIGKKGAKKRWGIKKVVTK